ncbi:hypothetical protein P280DRAFT_150151 [Massarina eburnea CBS 473.64]|uniref:Uncharacterized protein n=1 Tax=Massarina eburnea CBS 473.64 TaxID=1395130 RepID=A0A6A6RM82_9PLEO|nr:hypothetical protein P280DRAFT_150151 [Massarina eburnea CBS 473.64]
MGVSVAARRRASPLPSPPLLNGRLSLAAPHARPYSTAADLDSWESVPSTDVRSPGPSQRLPSWPPWLSWPSRPPTMTAWITDLCRKGLSLYRKDSRARVMVGRGASCYSCIAIVTGREPAPFCLCLTAGSLCGAGHTSVPMEGEVLPEPHRETHCRTKAVVVGSVLV